MNPDLLVRHLYPEGKKGKKEKKEQAEKGFGFGKKIANP